MFYLTRPVCKASNKRGKRESRVVKVLLWDVEDMPSGSDVAMMLGYNEMREEHHVTVFGKQEAARKTFCFQMSGENCKWIIRVPVFSDGQNNQAAF